MPRLVVRSLGDVSLARLAATSRRGLDRALVADAELVFATPDADAVALGATQRASELALAADAAVLVRRGTGGGEARVGPGTLWVQLALARADALVACEPSRLLNRYVRPLLRALTKLGVTSHYFDRDWISGARRPVALLGFAHDATSGRAFVEALVAVSTPLAARPAAEARPSFLGKAPATLEELGMRKDHAAIEAAIASAFAELPECRLETETEAAAAPSDAGASLVDADARLDPPWAATQDEAIGVIGAGRDRAGRLRVGGELMVSRDVLAALEARLRTAEAADPAYRARAIDDLLGAPGVALFGVRSLRAIEDVVTRALVSSS